MHFKSRLQRLEAEIRPRSRLRLDALVEIVMDDGEVITLDEAMKRGADHLASQGEGFTVRISPGYEHEDDARESEA